MPRARLESDAATRPRSTDANRVRPDATFGLPRRAASCLLAGSVQRKRVVDARSSAFGDARSRNVAPKRGQSWDRDASERRYRRTSLRRRVGVCVSAPRRASRSLCRVTRHPRFFHLRLCCALAGSTCRVSLGLGCLGAPGTGAPRRKKLFPSQVSQSGLRRAPADQRQTRAGGFEPSVARARPASDAARR